MPEPGFLYDAFISHAVEDKISIANELCYRLEQANLKIWYSGRELLPGDSINETVNDGLNQSRYGIIVFTHNFLRKNYTRREYYSLLAREKEGHKVIIPVLHNITPQELALTDLAMADRFAIHADKGMDHVIQKILQVIRIEDQRPLKRITKKKVGLMASVLAIIMSVVGFVGIRQWHEVSPEDAWIENAVEQRIEAFTMEVSNNTDQFKLKGAIVTNFATIENLYTAYQNREGYYRNSYSLITGVVTLNSKKRVEPALALQLETLTPYNAYHLASPVVYLLQNNARESICYLIENTQPVGFKLMESKLSQGNYAVTVKYENNIRCVMETLSYPNLSTEPKRHEMDIWSLLPEETYIFKQDGEDWKLAYIE